MKVKMKASMRKLTRKGIGLLAKKTKEAARAYTKAFLEPLTANIAAGNIIAAAKVLPHSEAASEVWDSNETTTTVYKDALFLVALELAKNVAREKEYENYAAAEESQEQLDEVIAQLRQLGDQRDLFEEEDEENESDKRQMSFAGTGGSNDDED
jgi:hypothetical protein